MEYPTLVRLSAVSHLAVDISQPVRDTSDRYTKEFAPIRDIHEPGSRIQDQQEQRLDGVDMYKIHTAELCPKSPHGEGKNKSRLNHA